MFCVATVSVEHTVRVRNSRRDLNLVLPRAAPNRPPEKRGACPSLVSARRCCSTRAHRRRLDFTRLSSEGVYMRKCTPYLLYLSLKPLRALRILLSIRSSPRLLRGSRLQLVVDEAESRKRQLQAQVIFHSGRGLKRRLGGAFSLTQRELERRFRTQAARTQDGLVLAGKPCRQRHVDPHTIQRQLLKVTPRRSAFGSKKNSQYVASSFPCVCTTIYNLA